MSEKLETIADVISAIRDVGAKIRYYADRIEAAWKRSMEHIHRAMVILAGIEMPDPDYPPRLWTALEDAYDALSDAMGSDGDTTRDAEEAASTGRHFVIQQPLGNAAAMRDIVTALKAGEDGWLAWVRAMQAKARAALAAENPSAVGNAAARSERDARALKPEPSQEEICAKCRCGESPKDCRFFGEPDGCSSPTYGHYPQLPTGNAAALREALEELIKFTCNSCERRYCEDDDEEEDGRGTSVPCSAIIKARAALSAPPRNCDVGTVEEQMMRFQAFCDSKLDEDIPSPCTRCASRCALGKVRHCELAWAQMPYEAKEGAGK